MTPVMLLTDGFLANASEPWLVPDLAAIEAFPVHQGAEPEGFAPYARDPATLARALGAAGNAGAPASDRRDRAGGPDGLDLLRSPEPPDHD
jgi:hypothetical protein